MTQRVSGGTGLRFETALESLKELYEGLTKPAGISGAAPLEYLRERVASSVVLVAFIFSVVELVPGAAFSLLAGSWIVGISNTLAFFFLGCLIAIRKIPRPLRNGVLFGFPVLLSLSSLLSGVGLLSSWIFAIPLLALILYGIPAGFLILAGLIVAQYSLIFAGQSIFTQAETIRGDIVRASVGFTLDAIAMAAYSSLLSDVRERIESGKALSSRINALEIREHELLRKSETDASAKAKAEKALRKSDALFLGFAGHTTDLLFLLEADGRIRISNLAAAQALVASERSIQGELFFDFVAPENREDFKAMFTSSLVSGQPTFTTTFNLVCDGDRLVPMLANASNYLLNPDIVGIAFTLHDMSREKKAEERAEFYKHFDPLTSLPNRDNFLHNVEQTVMIARNRNRLFAIMALGLDKFRNLNDMYGTETGDAVLSDLATSLRKAFRADDIVARFRGDMFFALFPEIKSQEHITDIIAKAQSVFAAPFKLPFGSVQLSASIGVAIFPNDGNTAEDLVRNAETALVMAKESGQGRYRLYDAALNGLVMERAKIESDLFHAVTMRAFEPFFQAKVDRNGFIVGVESLVRWRHPSGEIKAPGFFIEIAEKAGSIADIGAIMMQLSCERAAAWSRDGLPDIPVSVNISPRQFGRDELIGEIEGALADSGLPSSRLELEITESGIMENEREGIRKLLELKKLGVAISIDDFGTGYSSFSKLKDYPVDTIKIDKSFVDPLPHNRKATIIASAIIDLAHTLSFTVVAEGVESADQMRFLDAVFCDSFQGYLFSKPIPDEPFRNILAGRTPLVVH